MGRARKHVKNPINLTLRSKFNVVSGSWMYTTHRLMVIHPCAKHGKPMWIQKKLWAGQKKCQKPYKFEIQVEVQDRIWVMNVRICTDRRRTRQTENQTDRQTDGQTEWLRSKFKVVSGSWMYATHCLLVIHPCAKYGKPISIQKKSYGPDRKTCQNPYKFDLKVKVQGRIWVMNIRDTSSYGDTSMCQIW